MKISRLSKSGSSILAMLLVCIWLPAQATDTGPFELEGNAVVDDSNLDDWEALYNDPGTASFTGIVKDSIAETGEDDYFTGGGSKTPNPIEDWRYKTAPPSAPPDKNNITHAYAANYLDGSDQVIYFGADLFATNGDAELAFWFFQNKVKKANGQFTGAHKDGDVYVAVKFANGGTQANIAVYGWDSSCTKSAGGKGPFPEGTCAAENLRVIVAEGPATCGAGGDHKACAISNAFGAEPSPWPYIPKDGQEDVFPPTAFFEGGINIRKTFGDNKCFASFMATSGASTSFTSTAKDFVLDDFDVCSVAATKTCGNDDESDDVPTAITYNVRGCAINDGGGSINVTTFENSIAGGDKYTPSDLAWYVPADGFDVDTDCDENTNLKTAIASATPLLNPGSHSLEAGKALIYQFSESTDKNKAQDTVEIDAQGLDGADIAAASATATCPLRVFNTKLKVTKNCQADLESNMSNVVVKINFAGQVCNEGEVKLTNLQVKDNPMADSIILDPDREYDDPTTLGVDDCVDYVGYYYPNSIPSGDICPFADTVTATADVPVNTTAEDMSGTSCSEDAATGIISCTANSPSTTCDLRAVDGDMDCSTGLNSDDE